MARKQDEVWDALLECFGVTVVAKGQRSYYNGVVRDLKEKGATGPLVRERYRELARVAREVWKVSHFKPNALVMHWESLAKAPARTVQPNQYKPEPPEPPTPEENAFGKWLGDDACKLTSHERTAVFLGMTGAEGKYAALWMKKHMPPTNWREREVQGG